jgi:hypothetical protein
MSGTFMRISVLALAGPLFLAACSPSRTEDAAQAPVEIAAAPVPPAADLPDPGPALPTLTVYKTPTCGCCKNWVEHVKAAGFTVEVHDLDDLAEIKAEAGVPRSARSCHTAIVDGYAVEGHVPAETIRRLLRERPKVAGIAVPGMPAGSPGMEVPGRTDKYDVIAFDGSGGTSVYESH